MYINIYLYMNTKAFEKHFSVSGTKIYDAWYCLFISSVIQESHCSYKSNKYQTIPYF